MASSSKAVIFTIGPFGGSGDREADRIAVTITMHSDSLARGIAVPVKKETRFAEFSVVEGQFAGNAADHGAETAVHHLIDRIIQRQRAAVEICNIGYDMASLRRAVFTQQSGEVGIMVHGSCVAIVKVIVMIEAVEELAARLGIRKFRAPAITLLRGNEGIDNGCFDWVQRHGSSGSSHSFNALRYQEHNEKCEQYHSGRDCDDLCASFHQFAPLSRERLVCH